VPEQPTTPKRNKRQAWYGGPVQAQQPSYLSHRPSPEDSGSSDGVPTPSTSQGTEYHPVIISATNGMSEPSSFPPALGPTEEQKVYLRRFPQKPEPARADSGFQNYAQPPPVVPAPVPQTYDLQAGHDPRYVAQYSQAPSNDMGRLEALVAVATSENRAVEHRS